MEHDLLGKPVSIFPDHALGEAVMRVRTHALASVIAGFVFVAGGTVAQALDHLKLAAGQCGNWDSS
jgi:hypothetical protein